MDSEEVRKDHASPIKQIKDSWVSVAQKKQVLKKYEFEISVSEGGKSVEVPSEIIEKANPLWEDFVIARFLETAPHVAKVHMIINKIWAFGEKNQKLDVYEMDATTMRIRVTNEKIRNKVVRRGMWNIAGVPMVVSNWAPEEDTSKANMIPLWVHVTNVPMNMYSWEGLSFITSTAGVPDHLHPETIACTNFDIAKVFVLADLSKELPQKINYNIQGKETTVQFAYPWLPPKCVKCGRWGHYETFCREDKRAAGVEEKTPEKNQMGHKENKGSDGVKEVDGVEVSGKEKGTIEGDNEKGEKSEDSNLRNEETQEIEEGQINGWEKVTEEKASRSPRSQVLKYGQVQIATPSRFAVLSNSDENEGNDTEEIEEAEVVRKDEADLFQSRMEDSLEGKETRRGKARQTLPRQSKTNHRVIQERGSNKNL